MAINTRLIGNLGFIRGYANNKVETDVTYLLPPAPYGWSVWATGSGTVETSWVHPETGKVINSFSGNSTATGRSSKATPTAHDLATTVGVGVRFTGVSSLYTVGIAPMGADENSYATPPEL